MISSYQEMRDYLLSLDLGKPVFKIEPTDRYINIYPSANSAKEVLITPSNWLEVIMSNNLRRNFNTDTGKWVYSDRNFIIIKQAIMQELLACTSKVIDTKMPERTQMYKDIKYISYRAVRDNDEELLTRIIQILNYYTESRTDSTCVSNTYGLLDILRKRYSGKSNRQGV